MLLVKLPKGYTGQCSTVVRAWRAPGVHHSPFCTTEHCRPLVEIVCTRQSLGLLHPDPSHQGEKLAVPKGGHGQPSQRLIPKGDCQPKSAASKDVVWCGPDVFLPAIPPVVGTWTRTPDLYRVNLEVKLLRTFGSVAFPSPTTPKIGPKRAGFVDELLTSS